MTAAVIIIGALVMAACLFLLALGRVSARADRDARSIHEEPHLRYVGGENTCRTCGAQTYYSDERGPVCPGTCREGAA